MQSPFIYIEVFAAGVLIGLFYFHGLWVTIRTMPKTKRPAAVLMMSFFIRTALVVCSFFLMAAGRWDRLLPAIAGFILSRMIITRKVKSGIALKPSGGASK